MKQEKRQRKGEEPLSEENELLRREVELLREEKIILLKNKGYKVFVAILFLW